MSYSIPTNEQETVIIIRRNEDLAIIDTSDSTMMTKIRNLLKNKDTDWKLVSEDERGMRAIVPKNLITFRNRTRVLTDEERKEMAERARRNFDL